MFQPKFNLTEKILDNLAKINEANMFLAKVLKPPKSLLGSILNPYEWMIADVGSETDNYKNIAAYIANFIEVKKDLNIDEFLELHRLATNKTLEDDEVGIFRKRVTKATVRVDGQIVAIRYTDPEPKEIKQLLYSLLQWIKNARDENLNPILIASVTLVEFLQIHPFVDGNGRVARALATLILYESGYDFLQFFAIEDFLNADREAYLKAIHLGKNYEEARNADLTNWLEYFTGGLYSLYQSILTQS